MIFLYTRVSHKASAASGISIDEQCNQGFSYCANSIPQDGFSAKSYGSDTPGLFIDKAVSGWSVPFTQRPAGMALDKELQPGDHVVCYSIDRLARNLRDFANTTYYWQNKGVFIHYIADRINTTTATGRFQAHIKAAMAQFASDIISERTREALAIKRMLKGLVPCKGKPEKKIWIASEYAQDVTQKVGREFGRCHRYERVSTNRQYTSGLGLEHQSQANMNYATRHCVASGSEMGGLFVEDAVSAFKVKFADRPEGKRLLDEVRRGDDVVIYRGDRAWRNTRDAVDTCETLKAKGVYVHLVNEGIRTDANDGMDWIELLSSIANLESSIKSRRVKEAVAYCRRNGRPAGQIRRGFKAVTNAEGKTKLKLDLDAAATPVAAMVMREEMNLSYDQIRDVLCAWRFKSKKPHARMTIRDLRGNSIATENLKQAAHLKNILPEKVWGSIVERAWGLIRRPIDKNAWRIMSWEWEFNTAG